MPEITAHFTGDIKSPLKGQIIYRDDALTGFGLRVTPSFKSYIAECKVNGTARRVTLGRHGSISADEARTQAAKIIHKMSASRLPSKRSTQAPTLKELLALYLDRKTLRPATSLTYKRVIDGCLQDWLEKPITMITEEMVQTRHKELSKPNHMGTMGHDQANTAMHVLSRLLNYAADNLQSPDGQPVVSLNPVQKLNPKQTLVQNQPARAGGAGPPVGPVVSSCDAARECHGPRLSASPCVDWPKAHRGHNAQVGRHQP